MPESIVVVGGGIGGAVFAALVGRAGKHVVVLEKNLTAPHWVRPEVLWPTSMEVLFSLRPQSLWEQDAVLPLRGIDFHDGISARPFISSAIIQKSGVQPWSTNPNRTREDLLGLGDFEVRRGVEVVSVLKANQRIIGVRTRDISTSREEDVLASITVGDDGAQSLVRQACGLAIDTRVFPLEFLCFDSPWPAALAPGVGRIWLNPMAAESGVVGLMVMPLPNGRCAGLVPVVTRLFNACGSIDACWQKFVAGDPTLAAVIGDRRFPEGLVRVSRSWGHAARYGIDGAVLIGDAAHPVSPAGGQGANMSIADAAVLADVVLHEQHNILDQYERRRRRANARSLRPTRIAAMIWSAPWLSPISMLPGVVRAVARAPWLLQRFLRSNAALFRE